MSDTGDTLRQLVDERAPGIAAVRTLSERYGSAQGLLAQMGDLTEQIDTQIRAYSDCVLWPDRESASSTLVNAKVTMRVAHGEFHEGTVDAYNALVEAQAVGAASLDPAGIQRAKDADAALYAAINAFGEALKTLGEAIQTTSEAFLAWARETAKTNLTAAFVSEHPELSDALHVTSMTISLATVMLSAAAIAFPPLAIVAAALPLIAKATTELIKMYTIDQDLQNEDVLRRMGPGHGTAKQDEGEEAESEAGYGETAETVHDIADKLKENFEKVTEVVKASGLEHAATTMETVGHGTGGVLSGAGMVISQYNYGEARANPTVTRVLVSEDKIEGYEQALSAAFQRGALAQMPEIHGYDDRNGAYIVSIGDTTYLLYADGTLQTFDEWRADQEPVAEDIDLTEMEAETEEQPGYEPPEGAPTMEEWQAQQEESERPEREYEDNRW